MANNHQQPQISPPNSIDQYIPTMSSDGWFQYPVKAQPHHTDYGGVVWHGAYLTWMESARVECLRSLGIEFADLVAIGCDLPVFDLSVRYHRPVKMGMSVVVKTRMQNISGIRLVWDYQITSLDGEELYLTGLVTLVPVDREKGKIMRQLPANLKNSLSKFTDT